MFKIRKLVCTYNNILVPKNGIGLLQGCSLFLIEANVEAFAHRYALLINFKTVNTK